MAVLDFSDGLQQPSAFGIPQAQTVAPASPPAIQTTAATTPTMGAAAPTAAPAAPTAPASTCGLSNLSGCITGDNFIAAALGFLMIGAGLFMFKPVRDTVVKAAVTA